MSYVKTIWHTGDTVTQEGLNNIENGIVNNETAINNHVNDSSVHVTTAEKEEWAEAAGEISTIEETLSHLPPTAQEDGTYIITQTDDQMELTSLYDTTLAEQVSEISSELETLGSLAFKDSASGTFTPQGSVSQPTFSGNEVESTGTFTPSGTVAISTGNGSVNYTPEGTVSAPTITITPDTGTVNSIMDVGTLPTFTATVSNKNLIISFTQGSLPTKGSDTTVVTGVSSISATQPTFTGTGVDLEGSFSGTNGSVSVRGVPTGVVSQPSFTGVSDTINVE